MDITVSTAPGLVALEVFDAGALVAQADVIVNPLGSPRYRVIRFWLDPERRGDDAFAAELYPALIAKAVELGWATDDDLASYEWTDDGIRVGEVLIHLTNDGERDAALRFRLEARAVAEEAAAAVGKTGELAALSPEAEAVVELEKIGVGREELAPFAVEPEVVRDPEPPQSPSRPRRLGA